MNHWVSSPAAGRKFAMRLECETRLVVLRSMGANSTFHYRIIEPPARLPYKTSHHPRGGIFSLQHMGDPSPAPPCLPQI
jgi:hypothetical protein